MPYSICQNNMNLRIKTDSGTDATQPYMSCFYLYVPGPETRHIPLDLLPAWPARILSEDSDYFCDNAQQTLDTVPLIPQATYGLVIFTGKRLN